MYLDADAEREIPLALSIEPANRHDKRLFRWLFERVKGMFVLNHDAKFLADSACDAWDVRQELRNNGVTQVIAWNGRRFGKSETPKDRDYGKR